MKPYKEKEKQWKNGSCCGCEQEFPKTALKRCSHCDRVQYCSKECQRKNWPRHKQFCIPHNKSEA